VTRDVDAGRGIQRAASAAAAVPGDSPVEQVARGIALFRRNHPGYVSPATRDGAAPIAEVLAEAGRTASATPAAGTQCIPTWTVIEVGITGLKGVPRERFVQGAWHRIMIGDGNSATEPWNTWLLLCRDERWSTGDYGVYANLGGRYVYVEYGTGNLYFEATSIREVYNLIRFGNYDGNFQTLFSPWTGTWVTSTSELGDLDVLAARATALNGWTLFKVRPVPPSLCAPPGGAFC
jgi:hypothetical protein